MSTASGQVTGTKGRTYNLTWYAEQCLQNALGMETYMQDAEHDGDNEVMDLFSTAQTDSRKGTEVAKQLLAKRI
jgi:hypothetical protein